MSRLRVVGELDANFAWDGERFYQAGDFAPAAEPPLALRGSAASVISAPPSSWRIVRDPLGINKLFWSRTNDGDTALGSRPKRLIEQGCPFETIYAVPRGSVIDLADGRSEADCRPIDPLGTRSARSTVSSLGAEIRSTLDRYLAALADTHRGAQFFVCLSGGLDSSGIAALAREHYPGVTAVSFDLERRNSESEDREVARRLARDLRLPLVAVTVSPDAVLEKLDVVLEEGVDWRDFNVHAGLVNAAIAEAIAGSDRGRAPKIVLTGDLANEFLADYEPERYRGAIYYELPRLRGAMLREALVRGLDTSNREVGVFAAWGLQVVQPYAAAVDSYTLLPPSLLISTDRKRRLSQSVFGDLLPHYVYSRAKVRAQIGSSDGDGGILGLCVDRGIDASYLRRRFARLHGVRSSSVLGRFIRAGTYRASVPSLPANESP